MVSKLAVLLDEETFTYKVYRVYDLLMEEVASGFTDKEDAEKFIKRVHTVLLYGYNPLEKRPMHFDNNGNIQR